ncbi:hypothetical protein PsorP6_004138 [Peronosclerospora sorghi]|uniref:Uncharacterized protein n=1 Tax=Peronosclerospora sorghi TaxID=230839 RepID=A0ACC0VK49_9STRA|nr:hypothetical protein PsorP6_004138 [Peronosclerospora sorghi]
MKRPSLSKPLINLVPCAHTFHFMDYHPFPLKTSSFTTARILQFLVNELQTHLACLLLVDYWTEYILPHCSVSSIPLK